MPGRTPNWRPSWRRWPTAASGRMMPPASSAASFSRASPPATLQPSTCPGRGGGMTTQQVHASPNLFRDSFDARYPAVGAGSAQTQRCVCWTMTPAEAEATPAHVSLLCHVQVGAHRLSGGGVGPRQDAAADRDHHAQADGAGGTSGRNAHRALGARRSPQSISAAWQSHSERMCALGRNAPLYMSCGALVCLGGSNPSPWMPAGDARAGGGLGGCSIRVKAHVANAYSQMVLVSPGSVGASKM